MNILTVSTYIDIHGQFACIEKIFLSAKGEIGLGKFGPEVP
jgi:hypothetical protein